MPILEFIKNLFNKQEPEQEPKEETISIDKLHDWLESKSSSISNELNEKLDPIKEKIKQEIQQTKENLKKLEAAELRNPNITLREKQFMKGNREAYVKRVSILIDRINLPKSTDEIPGLCANFDKEIQGFGKATARPYHILQEFFSHESRDVALNINNIDKYIKELKQAITDAGLDKTDKIKKDVNHLTNAIKQKNEYSSEVKQLTKTLEDLKNSKNKTQEELSDFKKSDEHSAYEKLKKQKEEASHNLNEHGKQLIHSFAVLEKSLKKFQRIVFQNQELVERYAKEPLQTLQNDRELKILDILEKLESNIKGNKLDLKDNKKSRALTEIKKLNMEFFTYFLNKHDGLKQKLDEINRQLGTNDVENKITELTKSLEQANSDIESNNNKLEHSKQELNKIDINKLKSSIEEEANNLKVKLRINMPALE